MKDFLEEKILQEIFIQYRLLLKGTGYSRLPTQQVHHGFMRVTNDRGVSIASSAKKSSPFTIALDGNYNTRLEHGRLCLESQRFQRLRQENHKFKAILGN